MIHQKSKKLLLGNNNKLKIKLLKRCDRILVRIKNPKTIIK